MLLNYVGRVGEEGYGRLFWYDRNNKNGIESISIIFIL